MEYWESYFFQPKPLENIINDALVVVDTNVLLAAYQWREVTVNEVLNILKRLNDEDRLRIPEQVIMEFAKRRPTEIIQRINEIDNIISQLQKPKPLNQRVPMLEGLEVYKKVIDLQEHYVKNLNDYKEGLIEIKQRLKGLFNNDPILDSIKEIVKNARYTPENIGDEKELAKIAKERFANKKPPGYKDGKKEENSEGDYIVWAHILSLSSDVIFISAEKKIDWAYTDKHNNVVNVRRELVEEFSRETNGKTFCFINPKDFIKLINPNISDEVIEDLELKLDFDSYYDNLKSRHHHNIFKQVNIILNKFDPMGIAMPGYNEYDIQAKLIMDLFPRVNTESDMILEVRNIFIELFFEGPETSLERMTPIGKELYELKLNIDQYISERG
ncbi:PIN domain-containing protein [Bacillus pacificus]|uniref:PIN-like domain-containing protein n=1 Tax=Bacillus pacificus TaxID=2026187 RepID=UPI003D205240